MLVRWVLAFCLQIPGPVWPQKTRFRGGKVCFWKFARNRTKSSLERKLNIWKSIQKNFHNESSQSEVMYKNWTPNHVFWWKNYRFWTVGTIIGQLGSTVPSSGISTAKSPSCLPVGLSWIKNHFPKNLAYYVCWKHIRQKCSSCSDRVSVPSGLWFFLLFAWFLVFRMDSSNFEGHNDLTPWVLSCSDRRNYK